jgi:hypothetical protein
VTHLLLLFVLLPLLHAVQATLSRSGCWPQAAPSTLSPCCRVYWAPLGGSSSWCPGRGEAGAPAMTTCCRRLPGDDAAWCCSWCMHMVLFCSCLSEGGSGTCKRRRILKLTSVQHHDAIQCYCRMSHQMSTLQPCNHKHICPDRDSHKKMEQFLITG